jgi:hypothetical protein
LERLERQVQQSALEAETPGKLQDATFEKRERLKVDYVAGRPEGLLEEQEVEAKPLVPAVGQQVQAPNSFMLIKPLTSQRN